MGRGSGAQGTTVSHIRLWGQVASDLAIEPGRSQRAQSKAKGSRG